MQQTLEFIYIYIYIYIYILLARFVVAESLTKEKIKFKNVRKIYFWFAGVSEKKGKNMLTIATSLDHLFQTFKLLFLETLLLLKLAQAPMLTRMPLL